MTLVGLDVGTTGVKAIAISPEGEVVASAEEAYELSTPHPGWAEQDPHDWWRASQAALARLGVQGARVGLSGQMHGLVCLDADGKVLRPAILWNDQRTAAECAEIEERVGLERLIRLTGNRALTGFTAPKLLWLRRHEPEVYGRIHRIVLPKDYVRLRLTGEWAIDAADASGTLLFDVARRRWSEDVLTALEIPAEWLPPVSESTEIAGAGDQQAAALGVGVIAPGTVSVVLGTSGVVLAALPEYAHEPAARVHAFCHAAPNLWEAMGVMLNAAGSLRWFRDAFATGASFDELTADAENCAAGADGVVFLPYLQGERTPHAEPDATASFTGLALRHDRAALARAVLEGVAYGLRDSLELLRGLGVEPRAGRASGGGAHSRVWLEIVASVLDLPLERCVVDEGSAYGAALLAGVADGTFTTRGGGGDACVRVRETVEPNASWAARYAEGYARFRALYPAIRGVEECDEAGNRFDGGHQPQGHSGRARVREGRVIAVASREQARAEAYASEWSIERAYGSYGALLEDPDVDAVYISLPNNLHREWTIKSLEAGKHVICEKPFSKRPEDVEAAFDAAERAGRLLTEAFMYRHNPQTARLSELVRDGAIGELRVIRSAFSYSLYDADNIRLRTDVEGGSLMDVGCYCISGSRLLGGEPESVLARHTSGRPERTGCSPVRCTSQVASTPSSTAARASRARRARGDRHRRVAVPRRPLALLGAGDRAPAPRRHGRAHRARARRLLQARAGEPRRRDRAVTHRSCSTATTRSGRRGRSKHSSASGNAMQFPDVHIGATALAAQTSKLPFIDPACGSQTKSYVPSLTVISKLSVPDSLTPVVHVDALARQVEVVDVGLVVGLDRVGACSERLDRLAVLGCEADVEARPDARRRARRRPSAVVSVVSVVPVSVAAASSSSPPQPARASAVTARPIAIAVRLRLMQLLLRRSFHDDTAAVADRFALESRPWTCSRSTTASGAGPRSTRSGRRTSAARSCRPTTESCSSTRSYRPTTQRASGRRSTATSSAPRARCTSS